MTSSDAAVIERRRIKPRSTVRWGRAALASGIAAMALGALAGPAAASPPNGSANYTYKSINNNTDPTFNQLLGINNSNVIAGYYGSGAPGHPNKGYVVNPPYAQSNFVKENFPGSVQTQVTGLDNIGISVGFWVDASGNNFGFVDNNGTFTTVGHPGSSNSTPQVDQLLGVNDSETAVGFYTNSAGNNASYTYKIQTQKFHDVKVPGSSSVTATAINNNGDVAGFDTNSGGNTVAFLQEGAGVPITLSFPGATATQAFGVNDGDEVVGAYTDTGGASQGFVWVPGFGFETVDDPFGVGTTLINGVNDHGLLVGFYTAGNGNTRGMLATPSN
jgi:hypothetical protein